MRAYAGVTLVELVLASAIGAVLLTAGLLAVVSSSRLMQWVGIKSDVAQSALSALAELSHEMRASAPSTLTITSVTIPPSAVAEPAMAFEIEDPDPTHAIAGSFVAAPGLGATMVVVYYYNLNTRDLVRKVWPAPAQGAPVPPPPANGYRMAPADVATVVLNPNGSERNVATQVEDVSITPAIYPTGTTAFNGVTVTLDVEKSIDSTRTATQAVSTTIYPRNHW